MDFSDLVPYEAAHITSIQKRIYLSGKCAAAPVIFQEHENYLRG